MAIVRRLYVYLICGVSLFVLALGLTNLLELAIAQGWEALSGSTTIVATDDDIRQEVSLYLALVAVSLPIWLLHWYLAERWAAVERDDTDRGSGTRALFFALVLGVAAGNWISHLGALVDSSLSELLDASAFSSSDTIIGAAAALVVAVAVWAYHASVRQRDTRSLVMSGNGVWPVRLYMYAAAFVGSIMVLAGVAQLLTLAVDAIVGEQSVLEGESWWAGNVAMGLALVIVGALAWGIHWFYSLQVVYGGDWRAASEQVSALRRAYLYIAVLTGVAVTLVGVSLGLTEILRVLFGVDESPDADPFWARLARPLLVAIPFAVYWIVHRRLIGEEADRFGAQPEQAAVARLYTYIVSFLALALGAVGLAYLLGVLIEFAFESARILDADPEWVPEQISQFLSITVIGAAVWIWHWARAQRGTLADPAGERAATSRRVYLYLVLAATTLATLAALAVVVYQALQVVLDVRTTEGIASDIGTLIGVVLVAGNLLAYHVLTLREDLRLERAEEPVVRGEPSMASARHALPLVLTGPESADLESMVLELRRQLPAGIELYIDGARSAPEPPAEPERTPQAGPLREDSEDRDQGDESGGTRRIFG